MHHFQTCVHPEVIQMYSNQISSLSVWMNKVQTDPIISIHLQSLLMMQRITGSVTKSLFPHVLTKQKYYLVFNEQHEIGWQQFHEGFITHRWAQLQHEYYLSIGSCRSGKVWARELIRHLWQINYAMWHFRNNCLHQNKQLLDELEGRPILLSAIRAELLQGLDGLHQNLQFLFDQFRHSNLENMDT